MSGRAPVPSVSMGEVSVTTESPSVGDFSLVSSDRATETIARAPDLRMGEGPGAPGAHVVQLLQPFAKEAA